MICPNKSMESWSSLVKNIQAGLNVDESTANDLAEIAFHRKGDMPSIDEAMSMFDTGSKTFTKKSVSKSIDDIFKSSRVKPQAELGYAQGVAEGTLAGEMAQGKVMAAEITKLNEKLSKGEITKQELQDRINELGYEVRFKEAEGKLAAEIAGKIAGRKEGIKEQKSFQKEFVARVSEYLKTSQNLKGRISDIQVKAIIRRAANIGTSEINFADFKKYVDNVIQKENYAKDLDDAESLQSKLKPEFGDAANVVSRMKAINLSKLNPSDVAIFKELAQKLKDSKSIFKSVKFNIAEADKIMTSLEGSIIKDVIPKQKAEFSTRGLTDEQIAILDEFISIEDKKEFLKTLSEEKKKELRKLLETVGTNTSNELKVKLESPEFETAIGVTNFKYLQEIADFDLSKLNDEDLSEVIKTVNNSIENNSIANVTNAYVAVKAVKNSNILLDKLKNVKKFTLGIAAKMYFPTALSIKGVFGSDRSASIFRAYMGFDQVVGGFTKGEYAIYSDKGMADRYRLLNKKNKLKDTTENNMIIAVYSNAVDVRVGKEDADFLENKKQIRLTIDAMLKMADKEKQESGQFLDLIYKENLEEFNTHKEFMDNYARLYDAQVKASQFFIDEYKSNSKAYQEFSLSAKNKAFNADERPWYTPKFYIKIDPITSIESDTKKASAGLQSYYTGRTEDRYLFGKLPENRMVDLVNYQYNTTLEYGNMISEQESYVGASLYEKITGKEGSKERAKFYEIVGGEKNAANLINDYKVSLDLLKNGQQINDDLNKVMLVRLLGSVKQVGAITALASISQSIKQRTPLFNVLLQNPIALIKTYKLSNNKIKNLKLLEEATVSVRGNEMVALTTGGQKAKILSKSKFKDNQFELLSKVTDIRKRGGEMSMKALTSTDVKVANRSWLSFYIQYMKDNGVSLSSKDLDTEHLKIDDLRREAISYAEQKTASIQAASKKELGSLLQKQNRDVVKTIAQTIFNPFSGFSTNARARTIGDLKHIALGDLNQKAESFRSLAGTTLETIAFQGAKQYLIGMGLKEGILKPLIASIFNLEDKEEAIPELKKSLRKFYTNVTKDLLFSGFSSGIEESIILGLNYIIYKMGADIDKEDEGNFLEYLKEDPFFEKGYKDVPGKSNIQNNVAFAATYLGTYGIPIREVVDAYNNIDAGNIGVADNSYTFQKITEKGGKLDYDNTRITIQKEKGLELNEEEANFYKWLGIIQTFSLMTNLRDADIINSFKSMRTDIAKSKRTSSGGSLLKGKSMRGGVMKSPTMR
jgi:hypothetical protein